MSNFKNNVNFKKREVYAYQFLNSGDFLKSKNKNITSLSELKKNLTKLPNNKFFLEFKINSILRLKWYFDYLNNYLKNPNDIKRIIKEINLEILMYQNFYLSNWIEKNNLNFKNQNKWNLTRSSFDFMWTQNTKEKSNFELSKKIIYPRIKQILSMMPKNFLHKKNILDSGCGPGRYIDIIKYQKPKIIYGVDTGDKIIKQNKKKFNDKNIFFKKADFSKLPFKNNFFDFIISAGVLHHSETSLDKLIKEHQLKLKKDGFMFVFIKSTGGLELELWKFYRSIFKDIPIELTISYLKNKINPLRIQGFLDHCYGTYKEISRKKFELILKKYFRNFKKVSGVPGLDLTPENYKNDKYFKKRFGDGDLRYLLKK